MDIEKFEKIIKSFRGELSFADILSTVSNSDISYSKLKNIIDLSLSVLPDHETFLTTAWNNWDNKSYYNRTISDIISIVDYILELLNMEKETDSKISERKIFDSARDKIKQAGIAFQKEDFGGVLNNLNTALELLLKDKLEIPTTIPKINTVKIIEILISQKIGPYAYFSEAKKHICLVDNKIKHQSYSPSKIDSINALKVIDELESSLKNSEIKLEEEIRNKIYEGL